MTNNTFFHFYDESTGLDYRIPVSCTQDEWIDWEIEDIDSNDSIIATIEEETRVVHDTYTGESFDGFEVVGFQTYEADTEKRIQFLLNKWKEQLIKLGKTRR